MTLVRNWERSVQYYRCSMIITFQVVHVKEFYYVVKNCVTQLTLLELKKKSLITTTYLTVMKLKTRPSYFPGGGGMGLY